MTAPHNVPDHVVYMKAKGRLNADDIKAFVGMLDEKLARYDKIGVVSDVTEMEGMTIDGVLEDIRQEIAYLGSWDRFPNLALIAEDGAIKTAAETFKGLIPKVELRIFDPQETDQAIAFAAEAGMPKPGSSSA